MWMFGMQWLVSHGLWREEFFFILYMVKKLQDLSVSSSNICQGLLPQEEKKRERKPRVQVYWMKGKTELPLVRTDSCACALSKLKRYEFLTNPNVLHSIVDKPLVHFIANTYHIVPFAQICNELQLFHTEHLGNSNSIKQWKVWTQESFHKVGWVWLSGST